MNLIDLRVTWRRSLVRIAILPSLLACGGDPTEPRALPECEAPVTMTVSSGLSPTFSWAPACRVHILEVAEAANGAPVWFLFAEPLDDRAIAPGVTYGSSPPGTLVTDPGPVPPLETGTAYVVTLTAIHFPVGEHEVGRREFTP